MPPAREPSGPAARHQQRQVVARVPRAVRDARAVQNRHVVQERAVTVRRSAQLREVPREQLRVIAVDPGHVRDQLGDVVVVRQRVVRFGHADLRIGSGALLLADHEGDHAREIGPERQELQVQHQGQVVLELRRRALRLLDHGQVEVALPLGHLDAPLHVADRLRIVVDLGPILRSELPFQVRQLLRHHVQQALVLPQPRLPGRPVGAAAVAEQRLEHRARVPLHRQRLRRAAPGDRVGVDAAELAAAGAGVVRLVHRQLQRGDLGLVGKVPRQQLVHRHVGDDLHLVAPAAGRAGQERPGGAGVDVVPVRLESGEHEQLIAVRRQRLQDRRQLERGALLPRRPVLHGHPVGHVECLEPVRRPPGGVRAQREGGEHGVEERQADRRSQAAQNGPPRQRFRRENGHACVPLVHCAAAAGARSRKPGLFTIPATSDDQR